MTRDPFPHGPLGVLGGQVAQAWQRLLETWWKALLSDPVRLGDLAARLGETAGRSASAAEAPVDPAEIMRALELLEARVVRLEDNLRELAENLAAVVSLLGESGPGEEKGP